ncbi:MAG: M4 family metallopeptidase [Chloroflexota bacterium]|nr:M4 family metallopeptidase [Chloroflexota bacterium]
MLLGLYGVSRVEEFTGIYHGKDRRNYNNLAQADYSKAVKCRFEGDAPSGDPDCDNAYVYSGDTYDFFNKGFGRDSYDNQGSPLISYVHYASEICPNAFWNGQFMTYCSTFPHDDVAGHEITHGVTEFSANLVYAYQPGALNESFSDIFGEAIDLLNSQENELDSRWLIGEGIAPAVALRDMEDPESLPWQNPATCGSRFYSCSTSDSGGVHTNSGVPNKAFVLMVDGGSFNGRTVKGIGLNKSVAIQYHTLSRYLTPYSNFTDDYEALLASCRDLTNKRIYDADPETGGAALRERIAKTDCAQVRTALDAVEMIKAVCTDTAPTAAGPLCASGQTVASLYREDHETGSAGWTASNDPALYTAQNWTVATDFAASGTHAWRINNELTSCSGGDYTSDVYLVSPSVNLAGTSRPVLRFVHDFFTESGYDGGTIEININGEWVKLAGNDFTLNGYNGEISGAPNATTLDAEAFTGYRNPGSFPNLKYSESRVDLSRYVPQDSDGTVQFRFRFGTDYCNGTEVGWYLDDVEVYECKLP